MASHAQAARFRRAVPVTVGTAGPSIDGATQCDHPPGSRCDDAAHFDSHMAMSFCLSLEPGDEHAGDPYEKSRELEALAVLFSSIIDNSCRLEHLTVHDQDVVLQELRECGCSDEIIQPSAVALANLRRRSASAALDIAGHYDQIHGGEELSEEEDHFMTVAGLRDFRFGASVSAVPPPCLVGNSLGPVRGHRLESTHLSSLSCPEVPVSNDCLHDARCPLHFDGALLVSGTCRIDQAYRLGLRSPARVRLRAVCLLHWHSTTCLRPTSIWGQTGPCRVDWCPAQLEATPQRLALATAVVIMVTMVGFSCPSSYGDRYFMRAYYSSFRSS
jgi:hypothetical protein